MNTDSMKNASRPSIASGAPNTSPTNREQAGRVHSELEFLPNSVTTPTAKLIKKSLPKNFVIRR